MKIKMLYTITYTITEERINELVASHAQAPFNAMSNEDYKEYLHQEFMSHTYFSTDSEELGVRDLEKRNPPNRNITKFVEVDYKGNIKRVIKTL